MVKTKTRAAGLDNGHNGTKIYTEVLDGLFLPTAFSIFEQESVDDMVEKEDYTFEELVQNLKVTFKTSHALEKTNVTYLVGFSTLSSGGASQETPLLSDKHVIQHPVICGLSALALDAIKANPNKRKIIVNYDLTVALPVTRMALGKEIQEKRFKGLHQLIVHQQSGNHIEVTINIEHCEAIPEAVAASFGVTFDEKGKSISRKIINPESNSETLEEVEVLLKDLPLLHVDIGGGTTELVPAIGVKYNRDKATTEEIGSKAPILRIVSEWDKKFPRKPLRTVGNFNKHYYNPTSRYYHDLRAFSSNIIAGEGALIGQKIVNFYNANLITEEELYYIIIYGGASELFADSIWKTLKENNLDAYTILIDKPMFSNAKGLYVFANSPIFAKKKAAQAEAEPVEVN